MITNKEGKEIRLIQLEQLCKHCMCNQQDAHKIIWDNIPTVKLSRGFVGTCTNKAEGCDGYTLCDTCPIWSSLETVICLNA
jgi:hypothetical protein